MLPEGWSLCRLEELALVERGKFSVRPRNDPRYYGGNIPFVQTGDIAAAGTYITKYSQTLNEDGLKVSKLFPKHSILITIAANIGDTAIAGFDVACPDSVVAIQPYKEKANYLWLKQALDMFKANLDSMATQNAQKNINLQVLKPLLLKTPPLPEQTKIAEILSTWDKAIVTVEALIDLAQKQKKALMQQLLAGKKRFPGFKGKWKFVKLSTLCDIRRGASPRPINDTKWFSTNGRGWVRISDVTSSKSEKLEKTSQYLSDEGVKNSVCVNPGDLIMSICGTIGVPKFAGIPVCIHDGFVLFNRVSENLSLNFLYHYLIFIGAKLASGGQPGTQRNLNTSIVGDIKYPSIHLEEQEKIARVLSVIAGRVHKMEDYLETLKIEKKSLMQQLLVGERRVKVDVGSLKGAVNV